MNRNERSEGRDNHPFSLRDDRITDKVSDRKIIFLDMMVWIDLAEEQSTLAGSVKSELIRLTKDRKVICPLIDAMLWELRKQEHRSMMRVGKLMEELSLSVCFAKREEIFDREILRFMDAFFTGKESRLGRTDLFVPVSAYLSSRASLSFPPGWRSDEQNAYVNRLREKLVSQTLTELLELTKNSPSPCDARPIPEYGKAWKDRWQATGGNRKKIHRIEEEYIADTVVIPKLNKIRSMLPMPQQLAFVDYVKSLPKDEYGGTMKTILHHLPSIKNFIDVMAMSGMDPNRKGSVNDFVDIDILAVPLAYSDAFVSFDCWIRSMLATKGTLIDPGTCEFVSSMEMFREYLSGLD